MSEFDVIVSTTVRELEDGTEKTTIRMISTNAGDAVERLVAAMEATAEGDVVALEYGSPVAVGAAGSDGVATTVPRSDHVHAHGNQAGATLHAVAGAAAGFMSAADKTKLDGIEEGATAGTTYEDPAIPLWLSTNLVASNVYNPDWQGYGPMGTNHTPRCAMTAAVGGSVWCNYDANAPGVGALAHMFVAPTGVTQVTFAAEMKRPGASNQTVVMDVLSTAGAVQQTLICTVTATEQTFTCPAVTVTPGATYYARFNFDSGEGLNVQQQALVANARVTITSALPGSGTFSGAYKRIAAHPIVLADNLWADTRQHDAASHKSFWYSSAMASLTLETDATEVVVQYLDNSSAFPTGRQAFTVYVNGEFYSHPTTAIDSYQRMVTVSLPAGLKTVEIRQGQRLAVSSVGHPGTQGQITGCFVCAVYVATSARCRVVLPRQDLRTLVLLGDSTGVYYATEPDTNGWVAQIRRRFPGRTVTDTVTGGGSYGYISTAAKRLELVQRLKAVGCTHVVWYHCYNDWTNNGGAGWANAAAYQSDLTALFDLMGALIPGVRIRVMPALTQSNEALTHGGETIEDYRVAIYTAEAASTAADCDYINSTAIMANSATYFNADTIHPNDRGHATVALAVGTALGVL